MLINIACAPTMAADQSCQTVMISKFNSAKAFGNKMFLNVFVPVRIDLKRLADVRGLNRWCPGCIMSIMMFTSYSK